MNARVADLRARVVETVFVGPGGTTPFPAPSELAADDHEPFLLVRRVVRVCGVRVPAPRIGEFAGW